MLERCMRSKRSRRSYLGRVLRPPSRVGLHFMALVVMRLCCLVSNRRILQIENLASSYRLGATATRSAVSHRLRLAGALHLASRCTTSNVMGFLHKDHSSFSMQA